MRCISANLPRVRDQWLPRLLCQSHSAHQQGSTLRKSFHAIIEKREFVQPCPFQLLQCASVRRSSFVRNSSMMLFDHAYDSTIWIHFHKISSLYDLERVFFKTIHERNPCQYCATYENSVNILHYHRTGL